MTYRDDQDALLARNDALEEENARLKEELAAARAPKPEPKPEPPPKRKPTKLRGPPRPWLKIVGGVAAAACVVGLGFCMVENDPDVKRERASAARRVHEEGRRVIGQRWAAIATAEGCLEQTALHLHGLLADNPADFTAGSSHPWARDQVAGATGFWGLCRGSLERAGTDLLVPADARAALIAFLRANHQLEVALHPLHEYLANEDWEDDGFAGARRLWAEAGPALAAWQTAARTARDRAVPAIRTIIVRVADAREQTVGRDAWWWRLRVGLGQRELAAAATDLLIPRGTPSAPENAELEREQVSAAVGPAFDRLIALVADAPVEVRRQIRGLAEARDYLPRYGNQAEGISHLIDPDDDLLEATTADDAPLFLDAI